jgi:dihydrodipicolinate synthase/N-acetylneuraminate lyase
MSTVGIFGLGLIGGSFAKAYHEAGWTVLAHNRSKSVLDFAMLCGPEEITGECVLMGGHGGVNGGANMFPELYVAMYDAARQGDIQRMRHLQQYIMQISSSIYSIGQHGSS